MVECIIQYISGLLWFGSSECICCIICFKITIFIDTKTFICEICSLIFAPFVKLYNQNFIISCNNFSYKSQTTLFCISNRSHITKLSFYFLWSIPWYRKCSCYLTQSLHSCNFCYCPNLLSKSQPFPILTPFGYTPASCIFHVPHQILSFRVVS